MFLTVFPLFMPKSDSLEKPMSEFPTLLENRKAGTYRLDKTQVKLNYL